MRKDAERDKDFWTSDEGQRRLAWANSRKKALSVKCYECGAPADVQCRFPNGSTRKVMHQLRFEVAES